MNEWRQRRNVTYSDVKRWFFNRNLMHIVNKEKTYIANIILKDFRKNRTLDNVFCSDFVWDSAYWPSACDDFRNSKIDLSYLNQWPIKLSCGENIVKIYPMVVLKIDVKLRAAFLFAFSIYYRKAQIAQIHIFRFLIGFQNDVPCFKGSRRCRGVNVAMQHTW